LNNRYAYGNGNPVGNVDPNGHNAELFFKVMGWIDDILGMAGGINATIAGIGIVLSAGLTFGAGLLFASSLTGFAATGTALAATSKHDVELGKISGILGAISFVTSGKLAYDSYKEAGRVGKLFMGVGEGATALSFGSSIASSYTKGETSEILENISCISGVVGIASDVLEFKKSIKDLRNGIRNKRIQNQDQGIVENRRSQNQDQSIVENRRSQNQDQSIVGNRSIQNQNQNIIENNNPSMIKNQDEDIVKIHNQDLYRDMMGSLLKS